MRIMIVMAVLAMVAPALAERVRNPEYENWSRFKPGASVKLEAKSTANGQQLKSTTTHTLREITPEKLVIETATVMETAGQKMEGPSVRRDVPAEMDKAVVARSDPAQNPDVKQSEETITINGNSYACRVLTYVIENDGMKSVSKTWNCPDVPGGIVKTEVKTSGTVESSTEMTLVDVSNGE